MPAPTILQTETRNLMTLQHELASAERTGDKNSARWAICDLSSLADYASSPRIRARAIAELARRGFWQGLQPEPAFKAGE